MDHSTAWLADLGPIERKTEERAWMRCAVCDTTPRGRGEPGGSGRGECVRGAIHNRAPHRSPRSRHRRAQRARQNNRLLCKETHGARRTSTLPPTLTSARPPTRVWEMVRTVIAPPSILLSDGGGRGGVVVMFSSYVCVCDMFLFDRDTLKHINLRVHRRFMIQRGHEHTRTGN